MLAEKIHNDVERDVFFGVLQLCNSPWMLMSLFLGSILGGLFSENPSLVLFRTTSDPKKPLSVHFWLALVTKKPILASSNPICRFVIMDCIGCRNSISCSFCSFWIVWRFKKPFFSLLQTSFDKKTPVFGWLMDQKSIRMDQKLIRNGWKWIKKWTGNGPTELNTHQKR